MNLDIWQLFVVLLTTSVLQEFIIHPSVGLLRKYFEHLKKKVNGL